MADLKPCQRCGSTAVGCDGLKNPVRWVCGLCRFTLKRKVRDARDRIKARGERCEGRKPFGFKNGEDKVLARLAELRAGGLGFDAIAERANTEGLPTRTGKQWHGLVINRILSRKAHG